MHYAYFIRPARDTFLHDATEAEMAIVGEHFAYLQRLLEMGKLVMAGRREDAKLGIGIFEVESLQEAEQIAGEDPAVKAGVFLSELAEFRIALMRGS